MTVKNIDMVKLNSWLTPVLLTVIIGIFSIGTSILMSERKSANEFRYATLKFFEQNNIAHQKLIDEAKHSKERLYLYKDEVLVPYLKKIDENGNLIVQLQKVDIEHKQRLKRIEDKTGLY